MYCRSSPVRWDGLHFNDIRMSLVCNLTLSHPIFHWRTSTAHKTRLHLSWNNCSFRTDWVSTSCALDRRIQRKNDFIIDGTNLVTFATPYFVPPSMSERWFRNVYGSKNDGECSSRFRTRTPSRSLNPENQWARRSFHTLIPWSRALFVQMDIRDIHVTHYSCWQNYRVYLFVISC